MKVKRKVIEIDEEKCDGCGLCIPDCPEGALQIIDGKARLVSEIYCDGLGACIGSCPKGAIKVVEKEAEAYDERKVMERIVKQGINVVRAHLKHLQEHNEHEYLQEALDYLREIGMENPLETEGGDKKILSTPCACPGTQIRVLERDEPETQHRIELSSELRQWPIQLMLVPVNAPYFENADLLIAADCTAFAYANFHSRFLKGKTLMIGCPKLDNLQFYIEKLREIISSNTIKSITVLHMEVPCCFGLRHVVEQAVKDSNKDININYKIISVTGELLDGEKS